jgi:hypothetical protein
MEPLDIGSWRAVMSTRATTLWPLCSYPKACKSQRDAIIQHNERELFFIHLLLSSSMNKSEHKPYTS